MLKHKIEIYVPMNTPEQEKVLYKVFEQFCIEFGGATINPVLGGWIDSNQKVVADKIGIVYSYAETLTRVTRLFLKKLTVRVREDLKEDTIMLVMDGNAEFY